MSDIIDTLDLSKTPSNLPTGRNILTKKLITTPSGLANIIKMIKSKGDERKTIFPLISVEILLKGDDISKYSVGKEHRNILDRCLSAFIKWRETYSKIIKTKIPELTTIVREG